MHNQLDEFKAIVRENNLKPDFIYHEWMFEHHLEIVHRIAMELCDIYTDADRDVVEALVWFHDYGKPIDEENEREVTRTQGVEVMRECGFADDFIQTVLERWELMEKKNEIDIRMTPIETQIVSSADGCSHLTGVFHATWFRDYADKSLAEIQELVKKKIEQDWDRKIVLPEARTAFSAHYLRARELFNDFPEKFV